MNFWLTQLEPKLRFANVDVSALDGADCIRVNLENELLKKPTIAILGGHGRSDLLGGEMNEVVLAACTNDQLLNGIHSFLVSCQTGKQLGFSIINKGGAGYVGFNQDLVWIIGENEDPLTEQWHITLMNVIHTIALSYVAAIQHGEPNPAAIATNAGISKCDEEITNLSYSEDPMAPDVIHWMIWAKYSIVGLDQGEKITYAVPPIVPFLLVAVPVAAALWYFSKDKNQERDDSSN